ncbi:MAG: hypothetical protein ABJE10_23365 [bacterium]
MGIYADVPTAKRFKEAYARSGKKLDMGKSCVHFKTLDDLPLDVIGGAIASVPMNDYIALYEWSRLQTKAGQRLQFQPFAFLHAHRSSGPAGWGDAVAPFRPVTIETTS